MELLSVGSSVARLAVSEDLSPQLLQTGYLHCAQIAKLEEQQLAAEGKYSSKQEEVNEKTKKLKKLWHKFQVRAPLSVDVALGFGQRQHTGIALTRMPCNVCSCCICDTACCCPPAQHKA